MALGKQIRHHRERQGLTLDQLSELCGVDIGTISALEIRDSSRSKYATAIARGLGMSLEELEQSRIPAATIAISPEQAAVTPPQHTAIADPAPTITGRHQKLIALFEALTPERQDQLIRDLQNAQQADEEAAERLSADRLEAILKRKKSRRAVETRQFAPTAPIAVNPDIPALESP